MASDCGSDIGYGSDEGGEDAMSDMGDEESSRGRFGVIASSTAWLIWRFRGEGEPSNGIDTSWLELPDEKLAACTPVT